MSGENTEALKNFYPQVKTGFCRQFRIAIIVIFDFTHYAKPVYDPFSALEKTPFLLIPMFFS